jgi:hypothetical protein
MNIMANQSNSTKGRQAVITKTTIREGGEAVGVLIKCINGESVTVLSGDLSPEMQREAMAHGLSQKLGDATAIGRDPDTGRSATVADKWNALVEVYSRLLGGEWNAQREGGGNAGGLLYRALLRYYGDKKTPEQVREWLNAKTDAEKAALRKNPKIAAIILEIQAEGVDPEIDTDEMLDELDD